ncbi:PAS domain-containing protein [Kordiimonas aestuarii]|uniref:PAS domain-containing protein n=1 Tax=Kordiimonas aestuarii TaxID=1005925 RepID=UPI0021D12FE3|nr:PAS domain-containing protein [Kordiimonas aestuarii]
MSMPEKNFIPALPGFADHGALFDFLGAWNRWRAGALAPKRSEVRLQDMQNLMRGMMLMDVRDADHVMFRYVGSLYQDIYGYDFTGLNYLDITEAKVRELRSRRLWSVVAQPVVAVWTTPSVLGTDFIGVSVPLFPDAPDTVRKIMQVLVPIREYHHIAAERQRRNQKHVEFSDQFRYIDIGAGVPDRRLEA